MIAVNTEECTFFFADTSAAPPMPVGTVDLSLAVKSTSGLTFFLCVPRSPANFIESIRP
jgi:hypothetical protein